VRISKKIFSFTGLLLAATLLLGACGEEATVTPSSTNPTTTANTAAATTSSASTTAAGTVAATTTGAPGTANTTLPAIAGTTEVQVDQTITAEVAKQLGIPTLNVKLFTSDDDSTKVGGTTDSALTAQGYAFSIPGLAKPLSQNGGTVGLYSKVGSSDILFTAVPIPDNPADVSKNIPGIDQAAAQKFADQIKGKKTLLIVMTGPDLLQALLKLGQNSGGTPAALPGSPTAASAAIATPTVANTISAGGTTPASTTSSAATTAAVDTTSAAATSAAATTGTDTSVGSVSGADVIAYAGATGITLPDVLKNTLLSGLSAANNAKLEGFKSSDAPAAVKSGLMNSYSQAGWADATANFTGAPAALAELGPDAFFVAYTKDNKLSFVLGLSGATASQLGVSGTDAKGTVYIVGSGEK
jgi:hypothetical protein